MSNEWAEMLNTFEINASGSADSGVSRANAVAAESVQLVDLSELAVIEITGKDAPSFLQGQFCNDFQQVSSTHAQITGYCTPKGRLLALPTIVGFDGGYKLLVLPSVKEAFIKRLSMFIMRSDVTLQERDEYVCTGVIANTQGSIGTVEQALGTLPLAHMDSVSSEAMQVIRWHDDYADSQRARYLVIAEKATLLGVWNSSPDVVKQSQAAWRLADISAGVPSIGAGVQEAFVPQMLNLQLIDALSFTKGCYPGQEIVARMQYLGKLKRHMRLFKMPLNEATSVSELVAGSKLQAGEDAEAGVVVDVAATGTAEAGGWIMLLAVVKVSAAQEAFQFDDHSLQVLPLPYALPSLEAAE